MKCVRPGHSECLERSRKVYRRMWAGYPSKSTGRRVVVFAAVNSFRLTAILFPIFAFSQQLESAEVDTPAIEPLTIEMVEAELAMLKEKYRKDYKPLIAMDNHFTAFFGQPTNFWGLKLGLELFQGYRMGFGGYYMPRKVAMSPTELVSVRDTLTIHRKFRMHYYNTFMEFIFVRNWRWELALPFSLGYGIAEVEQWNPARYEWQDGKDIGEFVTTVNLNAHYRIFSWVGIGLGFGWRQVLSREKEIQEQMSGLTLSYKVKIFLDGIYNGLFHPRKLLEQKGDHRWRKFMKKNLKRLKREREW